MLRSVLVAIISAKRENLLVAVHPELETGEEDPEKTKGNWKNHRVIICILAETVLWKPRRRNTAVVVKPPLG